MLSPVSQRQMHTVEPVTTQDVAALNEVVVVGSKKDKDHRVDEETLEGRTVVVEVQAPLEEVVAQVKPQRLDSPDLFPRSEKRR